MLLLERGVQMDGTWRDYDRVKFSTANGIFSQKEKYLIIGLTGKVGAGCSTIAAILQKSLAEMNLSYNRPGIEGLQNDLEREYRIIQRFYKRHEKSFYLIKVRDVILSFILEEETSWKQFLKDAEARKSGTAGQLEEALNDWFQRSAGAKRFSGSQISRVVQYNRLCWERVDTSEEVGLRFFYVKEDLPRLGKQLHDILDDVYTELFQDYGNRLRFFGTVDPQAFESNKQRKVQCAEARKEHFVQKGKLSSEDNRREIEANTMYIMAERINRFIKALQYQESMEEKQPIAVVIDSIKNIYESNYLKDRYTAYYLLSASREEQLRVRQFLRKKDSYSQERLDFIDLNERPDFSRKKLKVFAKQCQTIYQGLLDQKEFTDIKAYISHIAQGNEEALLDQAVKGNPDFLEKTGEFSKKIDGKELERFHDAGISKSLHAYYCNILQDTLRVYLYVSGLCSFYLQDVENCIKNADIFLTNNEQTEEKKKLCQNIVRYLSLMMHPGLVPPTPVERCMQIAYTAKVNSGCISRQVGAVVTDSEYQILSLGWNDVPYGQTSCILRNLFDLNRGMDADAYSEYECGKDSMFKEFTKQYQFDRDEVLFRLGGLPACFCFKDLNGAHTGERNPMEARSMHGEERALMLCDKKRAKGGYLFTTSSPCLMCAKNAKEHEIKKIYYIEPYPGISQSHVCNSGKEENRAQYELFEGAIGRAYNQLYTPIIPYKDELEVRGIPKQLCRQEEGVSDPPSNAGPGKRTNGDGYTW